MLTDKGIGLLAAVWMLVQATLLVEAVLKLLVAPA
jgi:hypothetical protein